MIKKPQESWNRPDSNFFLRFLSTIDFSLQVILSIGIVLLLSLLLFVILRDRFQTFNYLVEAIHSM